MRKALRRAIITRPRLKSIYNKKRSYNNWDTYKSKKIFALKYFAKENRAASVLLILKVLVTLKNLENLGLFQ